MLSATQLLKRLANKNIVFELSYQQVPVRPGMNTSEFIPFHKIVPIVLEDCDGKGLFWFSGTGFFAYFPPFDDLFFVTAKHCVFDYENKPIGKILIPTEQTPECRESVAFSEYLFTRLSEKDPDFEDVVAFVVDEPEYRKIEIRKRAFRLLHQDDVQAVIDRLCAERAKIRVVGFPGVSKEMDFESKQATVQPRGFHGDMVAPVTDVILKVENISWKDGGIEGFSGSPFLHLDLNQSHQIEAFVVGVLLTGSARIVRYISINVVTNLIAGYIDPRLGVKSSAEIAKS